MTKQEIINYMYENHVQGDFKIEEMAEDLAQPEIIRCKDCVHNDRVENSDGRYWCDLHNHYMYYCSDGELRGDSDDN